MEDASSNYRILSLSDEYLSFHFLIRHCSAVEDTGLEKVKIPGLRDLNAIRDMAIEESADVIQHLQRGKTNEIFS